MGIRVGIDLGTTYTKIAFVDDSGQAVGINNMEGTYMTPSVVFFDTSGEVVVGDVAKELVLIEPDRTISGIKQLILKTGFSYNCDNHSWSSEEIIALIIKKVINDAANILGNDISEAVIAVPAYFGIDEWTAIKRAGEIAGLNVLGVLTETTATALSYGINSENQNKIVLIYDLGGSTFEVSVASISADKTEIICSDGNHMLGGKDWDDAIMQYFKDEFCSETGFDDDLDEYTLQDFYLKAERTKQILSHPHRKEVPVALDAVGLRTRIYISRTTFDEITQHLLNETIEKTDSVIALAASKGYKIDDILLVGGSTRMPQISEALHEKYGIMPKIYEPELAIAKGAAIYASMPENYSIRHVSTKSYALKVIVEGEEICQNIIIKNWQFSDDQISVNKEFCIVDYGLGRINLEIYESEYLDDCYPVDENLKLATITFSSLNIGLPVIIQVKMTLTVNGILDVCCINNDNGKQLVRAVFGTNSKLKSNTRNVQ